MAITEEKLLASGFTPADVQKLKNNIDNYGGSFGFVVTTLANRFKAVKWVTVIAVFILLITLFLAERDTSITLGITLLVVIPFLWCLVPARLAYKSWKYTQIHSR